MQKLNFPEFSFRFKNSENKICIFDDVRKKFIILQPEEWVRQNCVKYLHHIKKYPYSLINVEKELKVNGLSRRYDIVVFHPNGKINIVVECKSFEVAISQNTFDQIARYNSSLDADFLMVTNGFDHYYCQMDFEKKCYHFLRHLPDYASQSVSKQIN